MQNNCALMLRKETILSLGVHHPILISSFIGWALKEHLIVSCKWLKSRLDILLKVFRGLSVHYCISIQESIWFICKLVLDFSTMHVVGVYTNALGQLVWMTWVYITRLILRVYGFLNRHYWSSCDSLCFQVYTSSATGALLSEYCTFYPLSTSNCEIH